MTSSLSNQVFVNQADVVPFEELKGMHQVFDTLVVQKLVLTKSQSAEIGKKVTFLSYSKYQSFLNIVYGFSPRRS